MHVEKQRVFIGNLPPNIQEEEIRKQFSKYGKVVSVDVKQRKDTNDENTTFVFAFVNIEIDINLLRRCFAELTSQDWQGHHIKIELAKESFLDRLKRERAENQAKKTQISSAPQQKVEENSFVPATNTDKGYVSFVDEESVRNASQKRIYHSSSSESDDDDKTQDSVQKNKTPNNKVNTRIDLEKRTPSQIATKNSDIFNNIDEVTAANFTPVQSSGSKRLKAEKRDENYFQNQEENDRSLKKNEKYLKSEENNKNFFKEDENYLPSPEKNDRLSKTNEIYSKSEEKKTKPVIRDEKSLRSEEKRLKSLSQMKESYNLQKSVIKNALATIDTKPKNKIIFNDDGEIKNEDKRIVSSSTEKGSRSFQKKEKKRSKIKLFDNDTDEEEGKEISFDIKKQFEGKSGQKLLELQSRFTNDKRFVLDARFAEDEEEKADNFAERDEHHDDSIDEEERNTNIKILETVLGKTFSEGEVKRKKKLPERLLRFDPTKPEHSKFEIKQTNFEETSEKTNKKNKKQEEDEEEEEEPKNEPPPVEVSKEKFYEVSDKLAESLKAKQSFSLLNMFGKSVEPENDNEPGPESNFEKIRTKPFDSGPNPFKYDSSDTEDETERKKDGSTRKENQQQQKDIREKQLRLFKNERFFFQKNDERFSEGKKFVERFSEENMDSFALKRKELKEIIHTYKIVARANQNPFRKKLGTRKHIKVKKARRN